MRVDQGDAFAARDVLAEHGEHERALAGAGLADEVEPLAAVSPGDAEDAARGAAQSVVLADDGEVVVFHAPKADHPAPAGRNRRHLAHGTATGQTVSSLAVPASRPLRQTAVWVCAGSVWSAVEVRWWGVKPYPTAY